jgi:hypothetical protein
MHNLLLFACVILFVTASVNGLAFSHIDTRTTLPTHLVHQFPNRTWLENLAIRQNGQILLTALSSSELYQVDPIHADRPPALIYTIPGATSLLGIVEMQRDVFYVIAGNWSIVTFSTTSGSYSVWKIDIRQSKVLDDGSIYPPARASKVTDIPEGVLLDGMAVLNKLKGLVVIGDSDTGVVYTLDVETGVYSKTIEDATTDPGGPTHLGINGMKIRGQYLYYTTTGQQIFSRIPINTTSGTPAGPAEILATHLFGDDFSFDAAGNAYIGQSVNDTVAKVTPEGTVTIIVGSLNSSEIAGTTATAIGKTASGHEVLYITTSGGFATPVPVEGGKLVAVYI